MFVPSMIPCFVTRRLFAVGAIASITWLVAQSAVAQSFINLTSTNANSYAQNFDSLGTATISNVISATTGVQASLGDVANTALAGWYAAKIGGTGTAATSIVANNGSFSSGGVANYGSTNAPADSDRSLGALSSGSTIPGFGALLVNDTGQTLTGVQISFTAKFWRSSTSVQNVLTFGYGAIDGATFTADNFLTVAGATALASANIVGPAPAATSGPLDGNSPANQSVVSNLTIPISLAPGASMFIRWQDANDAGNDAGLAVDNLSLTPLTGAPPPTVPFVAPASVPLPGIARTQAVANSEVTGDGGSAVTARGFVYSVLSVNPTPTLGGAGVSVVTDPAPGVGPMSATLLGLSASTTYAVRSYATNSVGTAYSAVSTFTTLDAPLIFTGSYAESFSAYSGTLPAGWNGVSSGGVQAYGGEWGTGSSGGFRGVGAATGNVLGYQHTGTTGTLTVSVTFVNSTGSVLNALNVSYLGRTAIAAVDQTRTPAWIVAVNGNAVDALAYSTGNTDGEGGAPADQTKSAQLTGLGIAPGAEFTITWVSDRGAGAGSSRQIGLADFSIGSGDPTAPSITPNPSSITNFTAIQGSESTSQQVTVTGTNLGGSNIAVTSTNNFYVISTNAFATAGSNTLTLAPTGGVLAVRISTNAPVTNNLLGGLTLVGGGASNSVSLRGTVTSSNAPFLLPANNTALTGFTTVSGTPSTNQSFNLSGSNLAAPVTITPPSGWQISATNTNNFTASAITIATNPAGVVSSTPIFVRLAGTNAAATNYANSVLPLAVPGSLTNNVLLSGSVTTNAGASLNLTGTLTNFSATQGAVSAPQSFVVQGSGLASNVTISAPANLQFTTNTNSAYTNPLVLQTTNGALSNTVFACIPDSAAVGGPTTNVITASSGSTSATTNAVTTVTVNTNPLISVNPTSLSGFLTQQGTPSTNQTVTVGGTNLQGPITVMAPANYEVSRDGTNFGAEVSLAPAGTILPKAGPQTYADRIGDIDPTISTGGGTLDIVRMEVSETATDVVFNLTVNGNVATTDWGNFMIGIANGKSPGATTGNAWNRPINLNAPNGGMTHWIGSWVNAGGGSQFWTYGGTSWTGPGTMAGYSFAAGAQSLITYTVSQASLGVSAGDTIYFDAYSSGSGGTDSAVDALSNPNVAITAWGQTYTTGTSTGISSYTMGGGGGGGSSVTNTPIFVRLKADAAAANEVTGTLTASSPGETNSRQVSLSGRVAQLTVGTNALAPFVSLNGAASDPQMFTVSGAGLSTTPLVIEAPTGFVVSSDNGATYADSVTLTPVNGAVASTTITVRMPAGQTVGATPSGDVTLVSAPASQNVAVSGTVAPPGPTILFTPADGLAGLSTTQGTESSPGTVTVSGFNLSGGITATAPSGFEVAVGSGSYGPTATLLAGGGTLNVRIAASAAEGPASGNVELASGATTASVPVSGNVGPKPVISVQPSALQPFKTVVGFLPAPQVVNVSGAGLVAPITVTAPAGYQLTVNGAVVSGTTFQPVNAGSYQLTVQLTAVSQPGTFIGDMTFTSQGADPVSIPLEGIVLPTPVLSAAPAAISNLKAREGFPSAPAASFTVSGNNLLSDLVVSAPPNFEISLDGTNFVDRIELAPQVASAPAAQFSASAVDTAANYSGSWTNGANGGAGFGPWVLRSNDNGTTQFAGCVLANSANGAGDINTDGQSFALYANPGAAFANADRNFSAPMAVGSRLSFRMAVNFDNGNKGFDLFTGGAGGKQLMNFNLGGGASVNPGSGLNVVPGPGQTYDYGGPAVLDVSVTYVSPTELSYSISRTSPQGKQGVLFSGKITAATPLGAPDAIRFYNSGTDDGASQNNLYFNSLGISPPLPGEGGLVPPTAIYVRISATAPLGPVSGIVGVTSGLYAQEQAVTVAGSVIRPVIGLDPATLQPFVAAEGEPSPSQFIAVDAANLVNPIAITAPAGYEISLNRSTFEKSLSLDPSEDGSVIPTLVYVRITSAAPAGNLPAGSLQFSSAGNATSPPANVRVVPLTGSVQPWPEVNPFSLRVLEPSVATTNTNTSFTFEGQAGIGLTNAIVWSNSLTGQAGSFARDDDWIAQLPLAVGTNRLKFSTSYRLYDTNNIPRVAYDSPDLSAYSSGWFNGSGGGSFGLSSWQLSATGGATNLRTTSANNLNLNGSISAFTLRGGSAGVSLAQRRFQAPLVPASYFEIELDPNTIAAGGSLGLAMSADSGERLRFYAESPSGQPEKFRVADAMGDRFVEIPYVTNGFRWKFELLTATNYQLTVTTNSASHGDVIKGVIAPGAIDTLVLSNRAAGGAVANNFYAGRMEIYSPTFQDYEAHAFAPAVIKPSAYQLWVKSHDGDPDADPLWLPAADYDGDGLVNLAEFAFGGNPTDSASPAAPGVSARRDGLDLVVQYHERSTGAIYSIQKAAALDPDSWLPANISPGVSADQLGVPEGYRRMEFRVRAAGTAFYRVQATLP